MSAPALSHATRFCPTPVGQAKSLIHKVEVPTVPLSHSLGAGRVGHLPFEPAWQPRWDARDIWDGRDAWDNGGQA